jgi:putative phosphoribosyl transferase
MRFASRQDAGRQLGQHLHQQELGVDLVLGLPRGGVVVAAEVARRLQRPLDVLVVRKIGHPWHREFAVGALAEPDIVLIDEATLLEVPAPRDQLDQVVAEEVARLREYRTHFHGSDSPTLQDKRVLIIDDGLATGATAEAAVRSAKRQGARQVTMAAPVASMSAVVRLQRVADKVVALVVDRGFEAVGQYYAEFSQTNDEEVIALLHAAALRRE